MNTSSLVEIFFIISVLVFVTTLYIILPLSLLKKKQVVRLKYDQRPKDYLIKKKE